MQEFNTQAHGNLTKAREAIGSLEVEVFDLLKLVKDTPPDTLLLDGVDEDIFGRFRDIHMLLTRARVELVHVYEKHGRFA